ncbi:unnamed protein product [Clonostachys solani]|uniref:Uncharacterized protein n=1 Tax=Clonostachys solani TaxID=160281 RepID=A0A9N9ZKY7_9HYPO|nr:unnamed protein product [Clonostachys solani]
MVNFKQLLVATGLLFLNFLGQALATKTGHSRSGVGYRARRDIDPAALPADLEARDPCFSLVGLAANAGRRAVSQVVKPKTGQKKKNKKKEKKQSGKPRAKLSRRQVVRKRPVKGYGPPRKPARPKGKGKTTARMLVDCTREFA